MDTTLQSQINQLPVNTTQIEISNKQLTVCPDL